MYAVLKLALVFSGFTAVLYLSGLTLLGRRTSTNAVAALGAGLLGDISCSMLCGSVKLGLLAQSLLALMAFPTALRQFHDLRFDSQRRQRIFALIAFILLAFGFAVLCVTKPIKDWDARSIWFYHAKVINHTQSIWAGGSWSEQANIYTHLNYPKLFPLLAAQVATLFGFWNEYVPKLAIAILALPVLAFYIRCVCQLSGSRWRRLTQTAMWTLLYFGFDGAGFYLFNGYMDGWVALYVISALIVFTRALNQWTVADQSTSDQDWVVAALFLAVLAQIKQEGLILAVLVAVTVSLIYLYKLSRSIRRWPSIIIQAGQRQPWRAAYYALLLTGPVVAWTFAAQVQHLAKGHYSGDILGRMINRLATPADRDWIVANIVLHNSLFLPGLVLAIALLAMARIRRQSLSLADCLPLIVAGLYCVVVFFVYLSTSADLAWHMAASAGRVGLTPALCLAAFNLRNSAPG